MLVIKKGCKRTYAYGGSGIFGSIASFLSRLFSKAASNTVVRQLATKAATELGNTVVDAGKKLAEKGINKIIAPKPAPVDLNKQMLDITNKYKTATSNINSQIDGGSNAIAIQDLIKKLKGSGMKIA